MISAFNVSSAKNGNGSLNIEKMLGADNFRPETYFRAATRPLGALSQQGAPAPTSRENIRERFQHMPFAFIDPSHASATWAVVA